MIGFECVESDTIREWLTEEDERDLFFLAPFILDPDSA